jgi:hypothetical protein
VSSNPSSSELAPTSPFVRFAASCHNIASPNHGDLVSSKSHQRFVDQLIELFVGLTIS